jgi:serine/threonine protein phosphatase PrpC
MFQNVLETGNIIYASYTDPGSRPGVNQDAVLTIRRDDFAVFCVADGLGGHSKGEIASGELIKRLREYADSVKEPFRGNPSELFDGFERTVEAANAFIYGEYNHNAICGTTVVAVIIYKSKYCVISVGDSRAYRNDGEEMLQITRDDVWENQVGAFDNAALNGKLLKSVGTDENLICNRFGGDVKKGDQFFLCSDGIYKVVGDEYIKSIPDMLENVNNDRDAREFLEDIHRLVDEKGAPDNNTGIIVKC